MKLENLTCFDCYYYGAIHPNFGLCTYRIVNRNRKIELAKIRLKVGRYGRLSDYELEIYHARSRACKEFLPAMWMLDEEREERKAEEKRAKAKKQVRRG